MPPRAKSKKTPEEVAKNLADKETKKALKAIEDVQTKLKYELRDCDNVEMYKERNQTMKKRANNILKIPNFWLTALKNSSDVGPIFKVDERFFDNSIDRNTLATSPLHYFTVLEVGFFRKPKVGFKLTFNFDEKTNPFFTNKSITKEFIQKQSDEYVCKSNSIKWNSEYQQMLYDKKLDGKAFMDWLSNDNNNDYGEEIRNRLWNNPLRYYLNQANKSDDEDSDSDIDCKYQRGYGTLNYDYGYYGYD